MYQINVQLMYLDLQAMYPDLQATIQWKQDWAPPLAHVHMGSSGLDLAWIFIWFNVYARNA